METRFRPRCCLRVIFFLLFTFLVLRAAVYLGTRQPGLMQMCTAVHACADTRMPACIAQRSGGMQRREMGRSGGSLGFRLSRYSSSTRRRSASLSGNSKRSSIFISQPNQEQEGQGQDKLCQSPSCCRAVASEVTHIRAWVTM